MDAAMASPALVPLPVAVLWAAAVLLAALSAVLPRSWADLIALGATAAAGALAALLFGAAHAGPVSYWFGGWHAAEGVVIGIAFAVDTLGAALAFLSCLVGFCALAFARRYFDSVGTLFHVLLLVFVGACVGFSMSADAFNLFVMLELMGTAAYALTAYKAEQPAPLQGALNFAVTNTVAALLLLIGVALMYARTGCLNLQAMGAALAARPPDALVAVALGLCLVGFLTKAAIVPLNFWLPDAHAVAPSPVSVLLSGIMVEIGILGSLRFCAALAAGVLAPGPLRSILMALGAVTAIGGALMCVTQRHFKRMLAYSTVSHMGVVLVGVGGLEVGSVAGGAAYLVGHSLAKASLFFCAGVVLHRLGAVDEALIAGRARTAGRELAATLVLTVVNALALAGVPPFATHWGGTTLAATPGFEAWGTAVLLIAGGLTAAAVLRIVGRMLLPRRRHGGQDHGGAPFVEEGRETCGPFRAGWSMLAPPILLTAAGLALGLWPGLASEAMLAARQSLALSSSGGPTLGGVLAGGRAAGSAELLHPILAVALALLVAAAGLHPTRGGWRGRLEHWSGRLLAPLHRLQSGHLGDYVAFMVVGAVILIGALMAAISS